MSVKQQAWYPYVSVAGWGVLVFLLVLLNSGSLLLAVLLGAVVSLISWQIDRRSRDQSGGNASS
jgi:hypothetical protein